MGNSVKKILRLLNPSGSRAADSHLQSRDYQLSEDRLQIEITHNKSDKHDNVTEFWFRPSQSIQIKKVLISIENDEDVIEGNTTIEYNGNTWHLLAGYEDVQAGESWNFSFFYSLSDQNGMSTLNTNYTI